MMSKVSLENLWYDVDKQHDQFMDNLLCETLDGISVSTSFWAKLINNFYLEPFAQGLDSFMNQQMHFPFMNNRSKSNMLRPDVYRLFGQALSLSQIQLSMNKLYLT